MQHRPFIPLLFLLIVPPPALSDDYCALNCTDLNGKHIPHTACAGCGPAHRCGEGARPLPTTPEARRAFLARHNAHRNSVAKGAAKFGRGRSEAAVPRAANMRKLEWDEELEYTARCWANRCEPPEVEDPCRRTERFPVEVGQNRHSAIIDSLFDEQLEITRAVDRWFAQSKHLNRSTLRRYRKGVAPDAAQLLWARTTRVGCARTVHASGGERRLTTVCNYGPGGATDGSAVFLEGDPCSMCGRGGCCDKEEWEALCAAKEGGGGRAEAEAAAMGVAVGVVLLGVFGV